MLGAVVLLWGNTITMSRLFWSLVLVAVLLAVVQVLIGAGTRTRPPGRGTATVAATAVG